MYFASVASIEGDDPQAGIPDGFAGGGGDVSPFDRDDSKALKRISAFTATPSDFLLGTRRQWNQFKQISRRGKKALCPNGKSTPSHLQPRIPDISWRTGQWGV